MPIAKAGLLIFFTTLPALIWGVLAIRSNKGDYYWPAIWMVCGIMFTVSALNDRLFPFMFKDLWARHPAIFIFVPGALAWLVAAFVLGLLNLTPVRVGQDNGGGQNDVGLCLFQTARVILFYSPLEFVLLVLGALDGGFVIRSTAPP